MRHESVDAGARPDYGAALLESLGCRVSRVSEEHDRHPALEWAASGAMELTGLAEGAPVVAPGHLAACARGAVDALSLLAGDRWHARVDGAALLGERAAILGLTRRGTTSAGGTCRLLPAADGWIAINLPRPDDIASLPAWLGDGTAGDPWALVTERVARLRAADLVARARLLGLAAAEAGRPPAAVVPVRPRPLAPPWFRISARGAGLPRDPVAVPVIIDLSSLWAGPLCTHLLGLAGGRVIKVESTRRPDGARRGPRAFYDLLNGGKESVALDFTSARGRAQLTRLIERADIVVESARPRALDQLGIDAGRLVGTLPGLTWVSITGYGRSGRGANWVAFGDDAAVAAGLATATGARAGGIDGARTSTPLFCGDAIADPLAGMHAAVAALGSWAHGGGRLLDLALRDVVMHTLAFGPPPSEANVRQVGKATVHDGAWEVLADGARQAVAAPRARRARTCGRPLGADTDAVLRDLRVAC